MSKNIQNIQTSLNLQQTYSSLCSHVNDIYSKLSELQKQIQHHCMYMNQGDTIQTEAPELNQGDTIQIEAPKFEPNIDRARLLSTVEKPD